MFANHLHPPSMAGPKPASFQLLQAHVSQRKLKSGALPDKLCASQSIIPSSVPTNMVLGMGLGEWGGSGGMGGGAGVGKSGRRGCGRVAGVGKTGLSRPPPYPGNSGTCSFLGREPAFQAPGRREGLEAGVRLPSIHPGSLHPPTFHRRKLRP